MTRESPEQQVQFDRFWELICGLADITGAAPLNKRPDGWSPEIDERWKMIVNGTNEDGLFQLGDRSVVVARFSCYVEFNGWPWGILDPQGAHVGVGTLANLESLNEALASAVAARQRAARGAK